MKILHFADAHIGVTAHGKIDPETGLNDRVLDFLASFDYIIDYVEQEGVELVLFAGDMFHTNNPNPTLVSEVSLRVQDIAQLCPIVIIPGNHDQALNRVSALDYLSVLDLPNVYVSDKPCHYVLDGVLIGAMPYPRHIMFNIPKTSKNANLELLEAVYAELDEWLAIAESDNLTPILMFHGTLEGAQWGGYTNVALGHESHIHAEYLQDWDYVALGHIHKHQAFGNIVYPGSIERVDFGEAEEDKGFVVMTVGDTVEWKFETLPARPMMVITINLINVPMSQHPSTIRKELRKQDIPSDAMVKIKLLVDDLTSSAVDSVHLALANKVYRICDVVVERTRNVPSRLDIFPDDFVNIPHINIVEEWCLSKDLPDDDIDAILDIFEDIQEELDER